MLVIHEKDWYNIIQVKEKLLALIAKKKNKEPPAEQKIINPEPPEPP